MSISAMTNAEQIPPQFSGVKITQVTQVQDATKIDLSIGVCQLINSISEGRGVDQWKSPTYAINPAQEVSGYFSKIGNPKWFDYTKNVTATMLTAPKHGTVKEEWNHNFRYLPLPGFLGPDSAIFLVGIEGLTVKTVYYFKVIDGGAIGGTEDQDKKNCPKGSLWKITSQPK